MSTQYIEGFLAHSVSIIGAIDRQVLENIVLKLAKAVSAGGRVFTAGNGGGAAHASHFAADLRNIGGAEAYCLSDNVADLTARVNDHGWSRSYAGILSSSRIGARDLLFVLSVGGGSEEYALSENLIEAVRFAENVGAEICGVVGPDGGYLASISETVLRVPMEGSTDITLQTEGMQSVLCHLIVGHPALRMTMPIWELKTQTVQEADDDRA